MGGGWGSLMAEPVSIASIVSWAVGGVVSRRLQSDGRMSAV